MRHYEFSMMHMFIGFQGPLDGPLTSIAPVEFVCTEEAFMRANDIMNIVKAPPEYNNNDCYRQAQFVIKDFIKQWPPQVKFRLRSVINEMLPPANYCTVN